MKTLTIFILLFAELFLTSYAQDSLPIKKRIYKVVVSTNETRHTRGFLASISNSSLSISRVPTRLNRVEDGSITRSKIYYSNIVQVKIRRKGSIGRGILIGSLAGLSVGAISGFAAGDDPPCTRPVAGPQNPWDIFPSFGQFGFSLCEAIRTTAGQKAAVGGFVGAFTGAAVGAIVGALVRKTFIIGGNKQKLHEMKSKLLH